MEQTNIFEFNNYRDYLNVWLRRAKLAKVCTLTKLAGVAQVHATFLSQVLLNKKELSFEQAFPVSLFLSHSKLEREYFLALIHHSKAGNAPLKNYWREKIEEITLQKNDLQKRFSLHGELSGDEKSQFYSSWLYSALRLSSDIDGGQTQIQISEMFRLSTADADRILSFLVKTGLCIVNDGRYSLGSQHIHVPNHSPFASQHHHNWRARALANYDQRSKNDLFFTAPMVIAVEDLAQIREELNQLIKRLVERAKNSKSETIACLNIDLFKVIEGNLHI